MTAAVNGRRVSDTLGDDVQVCVRAPETPDQAPDPGIERAGFAHARAIPRRVAGAKANAAAKARNFASLHVGEAGAAITRGWVVVETPLTIGQAWRQVPEMADGAPGWVAASALLPVGAFRALVVTLCWLSVLAVGTRARACVALTLLILTVAAGCTASALT